VLQDAVEVAAPDAVHDDAVSALPDGGGHGEAVVEQNLELTLLALCRESAQLEPVGEVGLACGLVAFVLDLAERGAAQPGELDDDFEHAGARVLLHDGQVDVGLFAAAHLRAELQAGVLLAHGPECELVLAAFAQVVAVLVLGVVVEQVELGHALDDGLGLAPPHLRERLDQRNRNPLVVLHPHFQRY